MLESIKTYLASRTILKLKTQIYDLRNEIEKERDRCSLLNAKINGLQRENYDLKIKYDLRSKELLEMKLQQGELNELIKRENLNPIGKHDNGLRPLKDERVPQSPA